MEHRIVLQAPPGPAHDPRGKWSEQLQREFAANSFNGAVGNVLVSEDERCRVWHLHLAPGGFLTFHRHVLDYFWTAVTAGVARGYYEDGRIQDVNHYPGETRHFKHGPGEYFIHAIENVGTTDLIFVTVEFLPGSNPPIEIPERYRLVRQHDDADDHRPSASGAVAPLVETTQNPGHVVAAPSQPTIPVVGDARAFPVRRIWCVGRNFAEHAREMGGDPEREPPFFFAKPADAVVPGGGVLTYPKGTHDLHHEVELAVAIGWGGADLTADDAMDHIYGYAVALDMTRRDLQSAAKRLSRPWEMAKGFDQSCPISAIRRVADIGHPRSGLLRLVVDSEVRQSGNLSEMIWSAAECVSALSRLVDLQPGDLLLTGTPAGVGPVVPGQQLHASCEGIGDLEVEYRPA